MAGSTYSSITTLVAASFFLAIDGLEKGRTLNGFSEEPQGGIEPPTCALPRRRSTPKPLRQQGGTKRKNPLNVPAVSAYDSATGGLRGSIERTRLDLALVSMEASVTASSPAVRSSSCPRDSNIRSLRRRGPSREPHRVDPHSAGGACGCSARRPAGRPGFSSSDRK